MNNISYPLADLGILKPLMQKYADQDPDLLPFINHYSSIEAYEEQIQEKSDFAMDRDVLADDLLEQYQAIARVSESARANGISEGVCPDIYRENIEKLRLKNTFTVVTGHQPCLFTGPLYFIIKILQTIKLAKTLDEAFPDSNIIPVYWMGAEDHDFEEVNHFNLYKEKLTWESKQEGSVGRFNTQGLDAVYQELSALLGDGENSNELRDLFKGAYVDHDNYGDATRFLVNALFGDHGLVIVDGDRPRLKEAFKATMSKELKENLAYRAVNKQIEALQEHGKIQVNPREINLFYLDRLGRNRIIQDVNGLSIDGRKGIRNTEDLVSELQKHPDRFSPNVLLRPVYQETILPNLAYIGGPGETAYWLELKGLFREVNLPMPILEMRNSFLFIQQKQLDKLASLGLEVKDLFLEEGDWMRKLIIEEEDEMHLFVSEQAQIMDVMEVMKEKAKKIEPTMEQVFIGATVRLSNSLEKLEKRVFKAQKLKNEVKINQVKNIIEKVFPGGGLQERKENFAGFYAVEGKVFFERIYGGIDPSEAKMNVLVV